MVRKNTVVFMPFAPKNFLQNSAATVGGYSLQLKMSMYAALVSFAKCAERSEVSINWVIEYPATRSQGPK